MIDTPLYPLAVVALGVGAAAVVAGKTGGRRWGAAMLIAAIVQLPGYFIVARMMYATGDLLPQQLLFAAVATALTTKLVVFAPVFLGRLTDPTYRPKLNRHIVVGGLAASWLIQATLAVLYLFPDSVLRVAIAWITPGSPLEVYVWPLTVGAVLAQVTIAGSLYDHAELPAALSAEAVGDELDAGDQAHEATVVAADGGDTDDPEVER